MNRRRKPRAKPEPKPKSKPKPKPDWLQDPPAAPPRPMSAADLHLLSDGIRRGIRDTPAWKKLVKEHGAVEARRILRVAIYRQHGIKADGRN